MEDSYTFKYIKLYVVEIISILLGIVSLFVVVPYISGNKEIYGVYSLCISTMVFLSYADLGFMGAANKFAAEYFKQGRRKEEIEILSFGSFVLFVVAVLLSLFYFVLSYNPGLIIKGINESSNLEVARKLFFWMAIFSPFTAISRLASSIYTVRVENYINSSINIVGYALRIISVFYFFSGGRYEIVHYFIFIQAVPVVCSFVSFYVAHKKYGYDITEMARSFKWNKKCFDNTKDLALSSFAMTLAWILYYEIDQIVIAKYFGSSQVALYAIAFAILNYIRMFLGGLFSPFTSRFAHFHAIKDDNGLRGFFTTVVNVTSPLVICPLLALSLLSTNFVSAWSGPQYLEAVPLTTLFVLLNMFAFFSYPCGSIVTVFEKTRTIRMMAIIMPILYWLGVVLLSNMMDILSFGIMKNVVFWLQIFVYVVISIRVLDIKWKSFFTKLLQNNVLPIFIVCAVSLLVKSYITIEGKSISNLLTICGVIIFISLLGYGSAFVSNPYVRDYVMNLRKKYSQA